MKNKLFVPTFLLFLSVYASGLFAQAGITVSPSRLYFQPGNKTEQKLTVTNPNKDYALEVGISMNDWAYDSVGNNLTYDVGTLPTSCGEIFQILPGLFFTLAAGETKEISVILNSNAPKASESSIHTAMLYVTQLNPGTGTSQNGAAINVTVRVGVKIYQTGNTAPQPDVDITNFAPVKKAKNISGLRLNVDNTGNVWIEGKINYELANKSTGKKTKLVTEEFYSLPGDKRVFTVSLPEGLEKGSYTATAIVNYGKNEELKLAELDFDY